MQDLANREVLEEELRGVKRELELSNIESAGLRHEITSLKLTQNSESYRSRTEIPQHVRVSVIFALTCLFFLICARLFRIDMETAESFGLEV